MKALVYILVALPAVSFAGMRDVTCTDLKGQTMHVQEGAASSIFIDGKEVEDLFLMGETDKDMELMREVFDQEKDDYADELVANKCNYDQTLVTAAAVADQLKHDNAGCPELTGAFVFPDPTFGDMAVHVESKVNGREVHSVTIRQDADSTQDFVLLDGVKHKAGGNWSVKGLCANKAAVIYEYEGKKIYRTSFLSLTADGDLLMEINDQDGPVSWLGKRH